MYFFESYRASKRTVQSDPSISFVYDSFKCTWRLSYKILKKNHWSTLITPQRWTFIFKKLIANLQDIPNESLQYYLSTIWNVDGVQVTRTRHCSTLVWPQGGKMKNPVPYCTSAKYAQSYLTVSIVYSWKCRCNSSNKLYRKK